MAPTLVARPVGWSQREYDEPVAASSTGLERRASTPPTYRYEATGDSTSAFLDLAHRLIAPEIPSVELVHTGAVTIPDREKLRQESDTA